MSTAPTVTFNHLVPPDLHDPYPLYERLRHEGPVVFNPLFNLWFVTRYEEAIAVLKDPVRFSSADILKPAHHLVPEALAALGTTTPTSIRYSPGILRFTPACATS